MKRTKPKRTKAASQGRARKHRISRNEREIKGMMDKPAILRRQEATFTAREVFVPQYTEFCFEDGRSGRVLGRFRRMM